MAKGVKPGNSEIGAAIRLFHNRWSVPIVAVLLRDGPLRFGELAEKLPRASRDTLAATLRGLVASGLVVRDAGRPRHYALSAAGELVASECRTMVATVLEADILEIALKKWTMVALVAIGRGNERHRDIFAALPGITPRALTSALRDLTAAGLVARVAAETVSPAMVYRLGERGAAVFPATHRLVAACERAIVLAFVSGDFDDHLDLHCHPEGQGLHAHG